MTSIKGWHPAKLHVCRPTRIWRLLAPVRDFMESGIRWCLGKGFVDFWYDRWLLKVPLVEKVGVVDPPHMLVAEFFGERG